MWHWAYTVYIFNNINSKEHVVSNSSVRPFVEGRHIGTASPYSKLFCHKIFETLSTLLELLTRIIMFPPSNLPILERSDNRHNIGWRENKLKFYSTDKVSNKVQKKLAHSNIFSAELISATPQSTILRWCFLSNWLVTSSSFSNREEKPSRIAFINRSLWVGIFWKSVWHDSGFPRRKLTAKLN